MSEDAQTGADWSAREIDLIVADYFFMLDEELAGRRVNKAEHNRALQQLIGRSHGSIEFKHQNISAVLDWLGSPWISGYKPMGNYQRALVAGIERAIEMRDSVASPASIVGEFPNGQVKHISFEAAPSLERANEEVPAPLRRLVRKFDPAARDARNRTLGREGEASVFKAEIDRLASAGRRDLASKVQWTSQELGDGAGYDIHSFSLDGTDRLLEVKTTQGHRATPFFLTRNEIDVSEERPDAYRIVRVYDFVRNARAFKIAPPLHEHLRLQPTVYRASF